jgi:hypothetical protein
MNPKEHHELVLQLSEDKNAPKSIGDFCRWLSEQTGDSLFFPIPASDDPKYRTNRNKHYIIHNAIGEIYFQESYLNHYGERQEITQRKVYSLTTNPRTFEYYKNDTVSSRYRGWPQHKNFTTTCVQWYDWFILENNKKIREEADSALLGIVYPCIIRIIKSYFDNSHQDLVDRARKLVSIYM